MSRFTHDPIIVIVHVDDDVIDIHVVNASGDKLDNLLDEVGHAMQCEVSRVLGPGAEAVDEALDSIDRCGPHPDAPTTIRVNFDITPDRVSRVLRRELGIQMAGNIFMGVRQ